MKRIKNIISILIILSLFGLFLYYASERAEQIDNGEITVISENYMK